MIRCECGHNLAESCEEEGTTPYTQRLHLDEGDGLSWYDRDTYPSEDTATHYRCTECGRKHGPGTAAFGQIVAAIERGGYNR